LYTCPRAATVVALTQPTQLYRVDQKTFRFILQTQTVQGSKDKAALLEKVPFLAELSYEELTKLSHVMTPKKFKGGDYLMRKGDKADYMYIIQEGTVKAQNISVGEQQYEDMIFKAGDYVGERALITGDARAADVIATSSDVLVWAIDQDTFSTVLGNYQDLVDRAQDKRRLVCTLSLCFSCFISLSLVFSVFS
jgi:cAMP-dependent protein kinase regulator